MVILPCCLLQVHCLFSNDNPHLQNVDHILFPICPPKCAVATISIWNRGDPFCSINPQGKYMNQYLLLQATQNCFALQMWFQPLVQCKDYPCSPIYRSYYQKRNIKQHLDSTRCKEKLSDNIFLRV